MNIFLNVVFSHFISSYSFVIKLLTFVNSDLLLLIFHLFHFCGLYSIVQSGY